MLLTVAVIKCQKQLGGEHFSSQFRRNRSLIRKHRNHFHLYVGERERESSELDMYFFTVRHLISSYAAESWQEQRNTGTKADTVVTVKIADTGKRPRTNRYLFLFV